MRRGVGWLLIVGGVVALWVGGTVGSDARDRGDSPPYWAWQCLLWGVLGLVIGLFLKADSPADPILDTVDRLVRLAAWCRRWGAVGASRLWEGRRWWAADAPDDGTLVRRIPYTAWAGAVGATLGWAVWIIGAVASAHPRDLAVSAVVGGVLGLALVGAERYRQARRQDAAGYSAGGALPVSARLVFSTLVLVFVRVALEDGSGDLIKAVYRPLFISVVTYLPAAALLGLVLDRGRTPQSGEGDEDEEDEGKHGLRPKGKGKGEGEFDVRGVWLAFGFAGFPLGFVIGTLVFLLDLAIGEGVGWGAVTGWWVMICVSGALVRSFGAKGVLLGVVALVCALGLALWGATSPTEVYTEHDLPRNALPSELATYFGNALVAAPDVPGHSWGEAQAQLRASGSTAGFDPVIPASVTEPFGRFVNCGGIPATASPDHPQSYLSRKRLFCGDLRDGWSSGMARSWIVLAGFFLGLGVAARFDARLIPRDYRASLTRRYDRYAAVATLAAALAAAILLRVR